MKPTRFEGIRTAAVHAGEEPNPLTGASAPDIVMSTTFLINPDVSFSANLLTEETPFAYTRWGNPTVSQLEQKLAALEGSEACVAFASGMAAITALLFRVLKAGDHVVMSDVTYAAASELANDTLPKLGIEISRVDTSDPENVRSALRSNTRLVYLETPTNPILRLTDVATVATMAHEAGALVAVDSTFATPIALQPIALGVDFVIHSLTKYICGHGDALGGAVCGSQQEMALLRPMAVHLGGILSPFNAWLIMRGAATLPVRMHAHEENALTLAQYLEGHPQITRVIYPGLPSHPQHELAKEQMANFSGMITFQMRDGLAAARAFSTKLQTIHYAVSLGHHRSLVVYIPTEDMLKTSFRLTAEQEASYRHFAGDGVFRFSVGLEDPADIMADLDQALAEIE